MALGLERVNEAAVAQLGTDAHRADDLDRGLVADEADRHFIADDELLDQDRLAIVTRELAVKSERLVPPFDQAVLADTLARPFQRRLDKPRPAVGIEPGGEGFDVFPRRVTRNRHSAGDRDDLG